MKHLYAKFLLFILLCFSCDATANPLLFIENKGQIIDQYKHSRPDIDLSIPGKNITLFIGAGQLHYQFAKNVKDKIGENYSTQMYRLDVELIGADKNAILLKEEPQYFTERYYTELFGTDGATAHSFTKAIYKNIYPGIDWVLYIKNGKLKHEFLVKKGANASLIKFKYTGATSMQLSSDGNLTVSTPLGDVTEASPYSYDSKGKSIASSFVLKADELTFTVANYEGELTIDPAVGWATYYGGADSDYGTGVTHDLAGNVYLVGYASSTTTLATTGSHQYTFAGGWQDGYMAKFNQVGERIWATYYGGNQADAVNCVTVDNNNNVYIAGSTGSTGGIATPGTHKPVSGAGGEAFLAKFDTSGLRIWGTYYGGPNAESITRVACDNSGAIYVTGNTNSTSQISTSGIHQELLAGSNDAFLAKFTSGGALTWGTYLGGADNETAKGLCLDGSGNIYISGETGSATGISTPGSAQELKGLNGDVYLVKFNPSGIRQWGTYYGGNHNDGETGGYCAYNGNGNIYLVGSTRSQENISTPGALQQNLSYVFDIDAFIAKFDEAGNRLWGTYYGGLGSELTAAAECDNDGNVFFGGGGFSLDLGGQCSPQTNNVGGGDVFIAKVSANCEDIWATYHGGTQGDMLNDCHYDDDGNLYIAGYTASYTVFGSPNVYQPDYSGGFMYDGFLARYVDCAAPGQTLGVTGPTPVCEGDTVVYYVGEICGATSYVWSLPQGWGGFSTVDSIIALVGQPGTVSAYANIGCGSSSAQSLAIDVFPAPVPNITQNGTMIFTDNIYTSYQWSFNGADIPGATLPYHYITSTAGFYTVTVTDTNGCTGFANILPVSVKSEQMQSVKVFPNPAGNTVFVEGLKQEEGYEIFNVVGMKLQEGILKDADSKIDIATIPKGVYLLKIGERSMKLVKD
jgi:hypothetical protein